jgi:hypothetical protein
MSLKNTKVNIGKHKSKYKAPKDMEKSLKIPTRKEKYTHDDKDGKMNPYSKGKIQPLVSRKISMEDIIDDGSLVPKIKDRLYKKIQDGEYDSSHAQKVLDKLQKASTKSYLDKRDEIDHGVTTSELKESLRNYKNLSSLQKEELVRSLIRLKIKKQLVETYNIYEQKDEAPAPEQEASAEEAPVEAPAEEAPVEAPAAEAPVEAPAQEAPVEAPAPQGGEATPQGETENGNTIGNPKEVKSSWTQMLSNEASSSKRIETALSPLIKTYKDNKPDKYKQADVITYVNKLLRKYLPK